MNFLCLLGWSPKNDREKLSRDELVDLFTLDGINRGNAIVNFTDEDPFDPKARWLNAEHLRALDLDDFARRLHALRRTSRVSRPRPRSFAPSLRSSMSESACCAMCDRRRFLLHGTAAVRSRRIDPAKGRCRLGCAGASVSRRKFCATAAFDHATLEAALRAAATNSDLKTGQMFQPIRVAVCGRKNAPPLFETLEVLGRETHRALTRLDL